MTKRNSLIGLAGSELAELGTDEARVELQRRLDNGSRYAEKWLKKMGAEVTVNDVIVEETTPTRKESLDMFDMFKAFLAEKGIAVPTDIQDMATQVEKPKKKGRGNEKAKEVISGVNIVRTRDDDGWTWEIAGVWDGTTVDSSHTLTGHKASGATNEEAKSAFWDRFKKEGVYLARPYFSPVVDNRSNPLAVRTAKSSTNSSVKAPVEMTRDELKSALGLPENSRIRTNTLIDMMGEWNVKHEEKKFPKEEDAIQRGIANLLARFGG